ncbi:hypothetical protein TNCV_2483161 [Trichonephila clavipes]|uniref:Uncharacterized protein n=1 Tax=Trichonephila clavipes TaxID=2585209 RepID=A0A8X6VZ97_TRICX|nr:hypothetical protein TNCV_2483161 [Trichonephila clavipes]
MIIPRNYWGRPFQKFPLGISKMEISNFIGNFFFHIKVDGFEKAVCRDQNLCVICDKTETLSVPAAGNVFESRFWAECAFYE